MARPEGTWVSVVSGVSVLHDAEGLQDRDLARSWETVASMALTPPW